MSELCDEQGAFGVRRDRVRDGLPELPALLEGEASEGDGDDADIGPEPVEERKLDFDRMLPQVGRCVFRRRGQGGFERAARSSSIGTSPHGIRHAPWDMTETSPPGRCGSGRRSRPGPAPGRRRRRPRHGPRIDVSRVGDDHPDRRLRRLHLPGEREERPGEAGGGPGVELSGDGRHPFHIPMIQRSGDLGD